MSETTCPVLYPTEEEFRNFYQYINSIEAKYPNICICKIIPPKTWRARKSYDLNKIDLNITYPVKQSISGRSGIYSVTLFELKTYTLQQFYQKALTMEYTKDINNFKERERQFWRSIGGTSGLGDPIYGADVEGTLFTPDISHPTWNLNDLENLLNIFRMKLPGINTPMMYIGSWRAMFAWHVEDMDLYSINYLHYGACKSWYSIPPSLRKRFETFMNGYYPAEYGQCKDYLRHKTQLVSPTRLREQNIPYQTCVQHPGEFVITFPGAYHSGFNHGFNIAEATNFATERWIQIGIQASFCNCRPGSVIINMEEFETYYLREKKRLKTELGGNIRSLLQKNNNALIKNKETPFNDPYEYFADDTGYDDNNYFNEQEDRVRCLRGVCPMFMVPPNYRDPLICQEREGLYSYYQKYDCYYSRSQNIDDYYLQQCHKCDLYYHPQCIIDAYDEENYDLSYLKRKTCHICHSIDISDVFRISPDDNEMMNKNKRKRKKRKEVVNDNNNNEESSLSKVTTEGKKAKMSRLSNNRQKLSEAEEEENQNDYDFDLWFKQENSNSSSSNKPTAVFCSQPIDLTNDDDENDDALDKSPPVTATLRPSSSMMMDLQSEEEEEEEEPEEYQKNPKEKGSKVVNNLSYLNAIEKTKNSRKKNKESDIITASPQFKIGDKVKIKLFGQIKSTPGRIVSLEGIYGKFHVPNRPSQEDSWHPLTKFRNYNDPSDTEESEEDKDETEKIDEEERRIIEGPKMNYITKPVNYSATQKRDNDRYNSLVKAGELNSFQSDLSFLHKHIQDQSHINNSSRIRRLKGFAIGKVLANHVQKAKSASLAVSSLASQIANKTPTNGRSSFVVSQSANKTIAIDRSAPSEGLNRLMGTIFPSSSRPEIAPSSSTPAVSCNPLPMKPSIPPSSQTLSECPLPVPVITASDTINSNPKDSDPTALTITPIIYQSIEELLPLSESNKITNTIKITQGETTPNEEVNHHNNHEKEEAEEVIEDDTLIPIEEHVRPSREERKEKMKSNPNDTNNNNNDEEEGEDDEDEDDAAPLNDVTGVRKEDMINLDEIDTLMSKSSAVRVVSPEESHNSYD